MAEVKNLQEFEVPVKYSFEKQVNSKYSSSPTTKHKRRIIHGESLF